MSHQENSKTGHGTAIPATPNRPGAGIRSFILPQNRMGHRFRPGDVMFVEDLSPALWPRIQGEEVILHAGSTRVLCRAHWRQTPVPGFEVLDEPGYPGLRIEFDKITAIEMIRGTLAAVGAYPAIGSYIQYKDLTPLNIGIAA